MRTHYGPSGDGSDYMDSRPRVWWTPAQREHSENFIGSQTQQRLADGIRAAEPIGSNGMVRALPGLSISYQQSLEMLGMSNE